MNGGLVKTLHPKIHAGLLGERNNPTHQAYLQNEMNGGVFIDMAIVNLYPFSQVISKPDSTFEQARGNIDIGGPTMIRAAAKNFPSCAVVCNPLNYEPVIAILKEYNGSTTFDSRLELATHAFRTTAEYEKTISNYLSDASTKPKKVREQYKFSK